MGRWEEITRTWPGHCVQCICNFEWGVKSDGKEPRPGVDQSSTEADPYLISHEAHPGVMQQVLGVHPLKIRHFAAQDCQYRPVPAQGTH